MDNMNPTVRRICSMVKGCVPVCPGFGRGEMNEDLALHDLITVNTALHPNVYGVIVIALEDQTAEYITKAIAQSGKPVVGFSIEGQGGTVEVTAQAASEAIRMLHDAGRLRPEPMPWSEFILGVECGGSDGSSGIVSNPVTGCLADRVIDAGGTVIMSETLELLGGEELLSRRAVTPEIGAQVVGIIQRTLDYAAAHNLDLMGANPAPDNIAGGLTTIEEKALGSIKKGGTRPLVEVLEQGERPSRKGFVIMDAPAPGVENLTSIVAGGCHAVVFHRQGELLRASHRSGDQGFRQPRYGNEYERQYRRGRVGRHHSGDEHRSRYGSGGKQAGRHMFWRNDLRRYALRNGNGCQPYPQNSLG